LRLTHSHLTRVVFRSLTLPPPRSSLFPYTTLFRSVLLIGAAGRMGKTVVDLARNDPTIDIVARCDLGDPIEPAMKNCDVGSFLADRKSTRLNSSHGSISYVVFCLKKKITTESPTAA